jgi:hypothetical protein
VAGCNRQTYGIYLRGYFLERGASEGLVAEILWKIVLRVELAEGVLQLPVLAMLNLLVLLLVT